MVKPKIKTVIKKVTLKSALCYCVARYTVHVATLQSQQNYFC